MLPMLATLRVGPLQPLFSLSPISPMGKGSDALNPTPICGRYSAAFRAHEKQEAPPYGGASQHSYCAAALPRRAIRLLQDRALLQGQCVAVNGPAAPCTSISMEKYVLNGENGQV